LSTAWVPLPSIHFGYERPHYCKCPTKPYQKL
jgi:hypothetical protein